VYSVKRRTLSRRESMTAAHDIQDLHNVLQTEIEYAAEQHGLNIDFDEFEGDHMFGFLVIECSGDQPLFIAIYYFRAGVAGDIEFAAYTRDNFEHHDPNNLDWIRYEADRISIQDHFIEACESFDAQPLH